MIPNIENIVCNHLRVHSSITALSARVLQKMPPNKNTPWILVSKMDGLDVGEVQIDYLLNFMLAVHCYAETARDADGTGGGPPQAIDLAIRARAALKELEDTTTGGAVIKKVVVIGGPRPADEALDRELLTAVIHCHPD